MSIYRLLDSNVINDEVNSNVIVVGASKEDLNSFPKIKNEEENKINFWIYLKKILNQ